MFTFLRPGKYLNTTAIWYLNTLYLNTYFVSVLGEVFKYSRVRVWESLSGWVRVQKRSQTLIPECSSSLVE